MKSSIKVDYKSRYGDGDFEHKEPLIRIDLVDSDDPRDTLLKEIFRDEGFSRIGGSERNAGANTISKQYVIFRRSYRERWINDFASPVFQGLLKYTGIEAYLITSSDELYFEQVKDGQTRRSKGIKDRELEEIRYSGRFENAKDLAFTERFIEEWKDLEQVIKENK